MAFFAPSENVKFVVEENGGMLLDLNTGTFFGLSPTAARIWEAITSGTAPEEVADELAAETGADRGAVSADVGRLVHELSERGLIHPEGERP